jgi:hypothetical protein
MLKTTLAVVLGLGIALTSGQGFAEKGSDGYEHLDDYPELASGKSVTHTCPNGKVAHYLLRTENGKSPSFFFPLRKVSEMFLSCVSKGSDPPDFKVLKRVFRPTGSTGFKITAGSAGETQSLTVQGL